MLHIHKNVDGTYYINLEIRSKDGDSIKFVGNFQMVDGEHEQDFDEKFELNVPTIEL